MGALRADGGITYADAVRRSASCPLRPITYLDRVRPVRQQHPVLNAARAFTTRRCSWPDDVFAPRCRAPAASGLRADVQPGARADADAAQHAPRHGAGRPGGPRRGPAADHRPGGEAQGGGRPVGVRRDRRPWRHRPLRHDEACASRPRLVYEHRTGEVQHRRDQRRWKSRQPVRTILVRWFAFGAGHQVQFAFALVTSPARPTTSRTRSESAYASSVKLRVTAGSTGMPGPVVVETVIFLR